MNDQFIRSVSFDWNQIDEKSYLRDITAINGIDRIEFHSAIRFSARRKYPDLALRIPLVSLMAFHNSEWES